VKRNMFSCFV